MNLSTESNESTEPTISYSEALAFKGTKMFFYVAILILSSVGNTMVIIIICRFKHMKRLPGNLFIVNLALCDLLTPLISIPLEMMLAENENTWVLGLALCKLLPAAATFFATSSALTLAAISLDRYRTLMHPFKQRLDKRTVKLLIAFIHCCCGILIIPHVITSQLSLSVQCVEGWPNKLLPKIYTFVLFLAQYAGPLVFMAAMYIFAARNLFVSTQRARSYSISSANSTRNRNGSPKRVLDPREVGCSRDSLERHYRKHNEQNAQITKVFITIVAVFAVFTLPIEILWIWGEFAGGVNHKLYPTIAVICRLFTYANSCLNPIIFYKLSRDFHRGFLTVFRYPSSCQDGASTTANGASTWDRNGKMSPSWLTPRGSLQSTPALTPRGSIQSSKHSVSFADQGRSFHDNKTCDKLSIPHSDYDTHSNFSRVGGFKRRDEEENITKRLSANPIALEESVSNQNCNIAIKIFYYECNLTIELDKLESLSALPQTDC